MRIVDYIRSRGLIASHVAQKSGITRQSLDQYGTKYTPTARSLEKVAKAMTELGAETTVVDLVSALYQED